MKTIAAAAVWTLVLGGTAGEDQPSLNHAFVSVTAGRLRAQPSTESKVLMDLPYGAEVAVVATESPWIRVQVGSGHDGYLHDSIVSTKPLMRTAAVNKDIEAFKKMLHLRAGWTDVHRTFNDSEPDFSYAFQYEGHPQFRDIGWDWDKRVVQYLWVMQENLERWVYWDQDKVPIQFRMMLFEVLTSRMAISGVYRSTPLDVLSASKVYGKTMLVDAPVDYQKGRNRSYRKPKAEKSRFVDLNRSPFLLPFTRKGDRLWLEHISPAYDWSTEYRRSSDAVDVIHLLRLNAVSSKEWTLKRDGNGLLVSMSTSIQFVCIDGADSTSRLVNGNLVWAPQYVRDRRKISSGLFLEPTPECSMRSGYALFGEEATLTGIADHTAKSMKMKRRWGAGGDSDEYSGTVPTLEFDFDGDGAVDLIRSYESCPGEAGDSNDVVDNLNVAGKWQPVLVHRSWCNP